MATGDIGKSSTGGSGDSDEPSRAGKGPQKSVFFFERDRTRRKASSLKRTKINSLSAERRFLKTCREIEDELNVFA